MLLNLPLLMGVAVGAVLLLGGWRIWEERLNAEQRLGLEVSLAWLCSFVLLYAYYTMHRGFFQYYFREFLPPMVLLSGFVLSRVLQGLGWERGLRWVLPIGLAVGAAIWIAQTALKGGGALFALPFVGVIGWAVFRNQFNSTRALAGYVAGFFLLMGASVMVRFVDLPGHLSDWPGWVFLALIIALTVGLLWICVHRSVIVVSTATTAQARPAQRVQYFSFVIVSAFIGLAVISCSHGARIIDPLSYDCAWSPQTVASVVSTIQEHSQPEDEVLSGAVIWEFQAGRQPFATISHPLGMISGISPKLLEKIQHALRTKPPQLIVMDGFTEKTYLRQVGQIQEMLDSSYRLVRRVEGSQYPVSIYALIEERKF